MAMCCRILIPLCLLATITSTLRVYPHQLAYFNEAAGGPGNGYKHLLGSNLDWRQWIPLDAKLPAGSAVFIYATYNAEDINSDFTVISEDEMRGLFVNGIMPQKTNELHAGYSAIYRLFPNVDFAELVASHGLLVKRFPDKCVISRRTMAVNHESPKD